MGKSYFLNLNNNDDLSKVIKKCNTNFKVLATQKQQQDIVNKQDASEAIDRIITDFSRQISNEANARQIADGDIINAIDIINAKFNEYTKTSDLPKWEQVAHVNTVGESDFVSLIVDVHSVDEIVISDGTDQRWLLKLALPTNSFTTYTLVSANQFKVKLSGNNLTIMLGIDADWNVYTHTQ